MLFRGNLWKMVQQIGVNLEKIVILGPFGLFLDPLGASPCKTIFCGKFQSMTYCESLYCFEEYFSKDTKNNLEKRGKRVFWGQFWANFDHFG